MVKTFKNLLLQNHKADDLESWYAAFGTQVLPNLSTWRSWVDLDIFNSKVKFGPFFLCLGKCLNCRFLRNWWILWGESWYISSNKWIHDNLWLLKVRVIQWPLSKVTQIQHFSNFFSAETARLIEAKFHMESPWDVGNENLFKFFRSYDHARIW